MNGDLFVHCEAFGVRVEATGGITHRCPHVDETDTGTVTVAWTTTTHTVELHALRVYLDGWATHRISHEGLVDGIRAALTADSPVTDVAVTATFTTAGLTVGVSGALHGEPIDPVSA